MKSNLKNQLPVKPSLVLPTIPQNEKKFQIITAQVGTLYALPTHQGYQTVNDFEVSNSADDVGFDAFFVEGFDNVHTSQSDTSSPQTDTSSPQTDTSSPQNPDISVAFLPSWHGWLSHIPMALAGGAAIATSVGLATEIFPPRFEGQIQLFPKPSDDIEASPTLSVNNAGNTAISSPETIAIPPTRISEETDFLDSTILPLALEQVNAQGINLSQAQLTRKTELRWSKAGILEISYRANNASEVNHVLRAIAQTYQAQTGVCQSQSCLSAQYIQTQIAHKEQELARLQDDLIAFRQQHHLTDTDMHQQDLAAMVHKFRRTRDRLEQELLKAQARLTQQQNALGLPQNSNAALMLLSEAPRYQLMMEEWKRIDRQLVDGLIKPRDDGHQANQTQQYDNLSTQLFWEVHNISRNLHLQEMPPDLLHAIIDKPQRLDSVKAWLNQTQRVHLLSIRNDHLAQVENQLDNQLQEFRFLLVQQENIVDNIRVTRQTLTNYHERYAILQQQAPLATYLGWRIVAPPDITQTNTPLSPLQQWIT